MRPAPSEQARPDGAAARVTRLAGTLPRAILLALVLSLYACAVTDPAGNTPLILAAWSGDAEKVDRLIRSGGADVNAANRYGLTALMASTSGKTGTGDVEIARALIAAGANVNAANSAGRTALMEVAGSGNVEFVRLLLEAGADVNARLADGGTSLHAAALNNRKEIVRALLDKGAKPNVANSLGQTPLMLACTCAGTSEMCRARPEIVKMLIAAGADASAKDTGGRTASGYVSGGTKAEREEVQQILRDAGASK